MSKRTEFMEYYMSAIDLPIPAKNAYAIHQMLGSLMRSHGRDLDEQKIIYWVVEKNMENSNLLIRSANPTGFSSEKSESITVSDGDRLVLCMPICLSRTATDDNGERKIIIPKTDDELVEFVTQKFLLYGFECSHPPQITKFEKKSVDKKNSSFYIPTAQLVVKGHVVDAKLFVDGYLKGIGSRKGFGLGMPVIIDQFSGGGE